MNPIATYVGMTERSLDLARWLNLWAVAGYTLEKMIEEVNRVTREACGLLEPDQLCLNGNYPNFLLPSGEKEGPKRSLGG